LNPILIAAVLIAALLAGFGIDFRHYDRGAGYIGYFLTPVAIALAVPLYKQAAMLKKHLPTVLVSVSIGIACGMASIVGMAWIMGLDRQYLLSIIAKSVTTPIAIGIARELGGFEGPAVAAVIITGITGTIIAEEVLRLLRITHPMAKGLAIGTSAHIIGTNKAFEIGRAEGSASSIAMVMAGLAAVLLAPIMVRLL